MSDTTVLKDFGSATKSISKSSYNYIGPGKSYSNSQYNNDDTIHEAELIQYSITNGNLFTPTSKTSKKLPAGMYSTTLNNYGMPVYEKREIHVDELLQFPDSMLQRTLDEISDFWKKKEIFQKYSFLHRRGYLFYGPQGSGKSSLVQQLISEAIKNDRIILLSNMPSVLNKSLTQFRSIEPEREIICLFEDIDAIIARYGEDELLGVLDGENQIDNVLNIATTNYPEVLDKRIVARPRRFDRLVKIEMPSKDMRKRYFKLKLKLAEEELEQWTDLTDGFSFAALAELVISTKCLGNELDKTIGILKAIMKQKLSSSDFDNKPGFGD